MKRGGGEAGIPFLCFVFLSLWLCETNDCRHHQRRTGHRPMPWHQYRASQERAANPSSGPEMDVGREGTSHTRPREIGERKKKNRQLHSRANPLHTRPSPTDHPPPPISQETLHSPPGNSQALVVPILLGSRRVYVGVHSCDAHSGAPNEVGGGRWGWCRGCLRANDTGPLDSCGESREPGPQRGYGEGHAKGRGRLR